MAAPQGFRLARLLVRAVDMPQQQLWRSFWHDPAKEKTEDKESYLRTFRVRRWDHAFVEMFRAARPLGLPERLHELNVPVLVITGDDDKLVSMGQNERLAQEVPVGRLAVIADSGHLPQQEQPEELARLVLEFVKGLP